MDVQASLPGDRPQCVAVAYSGGRDSTALLHATACAALELGGVEVVALHVHHGLSSHADDWLAHAQRTCDAWAEAGLPVRFLARKVEVSLATGDSVEGQARAARYSALTDMAREAGADLILLAHHQRDQAETFLLQALRGSGVAGLAGMPQDIVRNGVRWVRPWLRHPREVIEAYLAERRLPFIDDDSNTQTRYARNRLRLEVWPALKQAFPEIERMLAVSAGRVADVLPGVSAWRVSLVESLTCEGASRALDAAKWSALSAGQRRESLAHWYRQQCGVSMGASWLERLAQEVPGLVYRGRAVRWPLLGLSLYRGQMTWSDMPPRAERPETACDVACLEKRAAPQPLRITSPGLLALRAWGGALRVSAVNAGGVSWATLAQLTLKARQGGEQFQAGPGRPARSLKKQFQSVGVPAWERSGPLIFSGENLLFVPGLGIDARFWAPVGTPQASLEWVPARPK